MTTSAGTLYVIATPLGNPADLPPRALLATVLACDSIIIAAATRARTGCLPACLIRLHTNPTR